MGGALLGLVLAAGALVPAARGQDPAAVDRAVERGLANGRGRVVTGCNLMSRVRRRAAPNWRVAVR